MLLDELESKKIFGGRASKTLEYSQSQVRNMIKGFKEERNQNSLREISEQIFIQSQQYQRLINYYASMPTYSYVLLPNKVIDNVSEDKIKKDFDKASEAMAMLKVRDSFTKIIRRAMIADIFFGYIYNNKTSTMIQQFPNEICKISSIEGGVYNFSINLKTFERQESALNYYPEEVKVAYKKMKIMKNNKSKNKKEISEWYELSAENSICIKINEGIIEPVPPFSGVFDSVYDINAFKDLRNDKAELENYKLIVQNLPLRKSNDNNDFAIDLPMMNYFHNALADVAPSNVGVATSPMEIEVITFDKDTADRDGVAKANRDFWDSSGTTQNLFSSDNKTSQGIAKSIETDEQVIFTILGQVERWINRYLTLNKLSKYFSCKMLDVTHFSKGEAIKTFTDSGNFGFSTRLIVGSILGIEPIAFKGLNYLENKVLKLDEEMIPLKSSFNTGTQDIQNEGGRPTNEDNGVEDSDETQRARDKPDNIE